jgi:hypothetical protein
MAAMTEAVRGFILIDALMGSQAHWKKCEERSCCGHPTVTFFDDKLKTCEIRALRVESPSQKTPVKSRSLDKY